MNEQTKSRIRELMFYVVPDPEEVITDEVLAKSESVDLEEGQQLKTEFRSIIELLDEYPSVQRTVLAALDDMDASSNEARGDDVEWMNACDALLISSGVSIVDEPKGGLLLRPDCAVSDVKTGLVFGPAIAAILLIGRQLNISVRESSRSE